MHFMACTKHVQAMFTSVHVLLLVADELLAGSSACSAQAKDTQGL
jgi:hypothetical protein